MNPMELNKIQPKEAQVAYVWKNITFVPHYNLPGSFVAPGHTKSSPRLFHENQLKIMGAKKVILELWPRLKNDDLSNRGA